MRAGANEGAVIADSVTPMTGEGLYTVVYDGTCRMCRHIAEVLRRWGRTRLVVLPYQTPGLQARFPWIPAQAYDESLQLVGPAGETWQGGAAVEQLLGILPRGRLIAWVFRLPLVRHSADRLYRWIARNRYRLGCSEHCKVSDS